MNNINTMKLDSYGKTYDLLTSTTTYIEGGGLAIQLFYIEEDNSIHPFTMLTVNLPDLPKESPFAFVDTNNFPDATELIKEYNLGEFTGSLGLCGFCFYFEYEFNLDEVNKYSTDQLEVVK